MDPPPTISLMPGLSAELGLMQGVIGLPVTSSHEASSLPGRCRPALASKRVNFFSPGRIT
ncbi:MAG: hypothetical protein E6J88_02565 [Deltaproteobacteria bacterium]|nr:MAG: hypothetical protein E6J88_02565 [Deltaproteobacteria bacterium]